MAELRTPQGHTLLLPEGCVCVGADPGNEVPVVAHLGLAPVHFRLQPWEGGHFLEDAGSGLGTLVNGHPVNWKPLSPGDVIVAGELEVVYAQQTKSPTSPVPVLVAPAPPAEILAAFPPPPLPAQESPHGFARPPQHEAQPQPAKAFVAPFRAPAMLGPVSPAASPHPPAWLPVDLLPESYAIPEPAPVREMEPSLPPPSPIRPTRRLLRCAAVVALVAGAGLAWQHGHLQPLFNSLRDLTKLILHPTPLPTAKPAFNPVSPVPTAPPTDPTAAVEVRATPSPSAELSLPQISTRPGR